MAHEHSVTDADSRFTIDKATREISTASGDATIMQFDHNSERLTFELPKEIDGHDMTKCNVIQVHYINIDSATRESNAGVYKVDDMQVSPDDESKAVLSWLISGNATKFAGVLNFVIKFKCVNDGDVDYAWSTAIYKALTVSNGMDNGETIVEEYPDILAQWEARIEALEQGGNSDSTQNVYYIATEYGISADAEDNTPALQTLVDTVADAGGGTIFFPIGTYRFSIGAVDTAYHSAIVMRSNVSIVGENIEKTVLKQTTMQAYPLFFAFGAYNAPLTGCSFSNFTVDAYGTGNINVVQGKAFFFKYVRNFVFRDLILKGTIATALGIDHIDQVVMDNITCIDCGRTYTGVEAGTSGIGIGSGVWDHENFIITNCICDGCGQYGIFIEDQSYLGGVSSNLAKGNIIANCIVRNGLNNGIGVRGGANITVTGCEVYGNAKHGFYAEGPCKDVKILSCGSSGNGADGICLEPGETSESIAVKGCVVTKNTGSGIHVNSGYGRFCICDNHTDGNALGLEIGELELRDCVLKYNTLLDDADVRATFTGNTGYNDFAGEAAPTSILAESGYVAVGGTKQIVCTVLPANADKRVTFESSDDSVAAVDAQGIVTGNAAGEAVITIRSVADPAVYTTLTITVMTLSVTVSNAAFTTGKMISKTGAETTVDGGAATDYVAIPGGNHLVCIPGYEYMNGARVALYDINKTFLTERTFIGSDVKSDSVAIGHDDAAYIRAGVNVFDADTTLEVRKAEIVADTDAFVFAVGIKIDVDGTRVANDGGVASGYVDISGGEGNHWYLWHNDPDATYAKRMALYDGDRNPISGTVVTLNNYGVTEISVPEEARYAAVCYMGTTDVNRTCQILTTEVAL